MKWLTPPASDLSRNWYRDSDCGRWRITISLNPNGYALLDRRQKYRVVLVGSKDACKARAEESVDVSQD